MAKLNSTSHLPRGLLALASVLFIVSCSPEDSDKLNPLVYESCEPISNEVFSLNSINTIVVTRDERFGDVPMGLESQLVVVPDGVSPDEISDVIVWYPDGTNANVDFYVSTWLQPHLAGMKLKYDHFVETNSIRQIPMNDYCLSVVDNNGNAVRQSFNLEMPDGTEPVMDAAVVNESDYGSISGGGVFIKSLALAEVTNFTVSASEVVVTVNLNDERITELELKFWNAQRSRAASYNIYDVSNITSIGTQTYTLSVDDLTFDTDNTISDIVAMTPIVYDTGNGRNGDLLPVSELGTWGYPTDL